MTAGPMYTLTILSQCTVLPAALKIVYSLAAFYTLSVITAFSHTHSYHSVTYMEEPH